MPLTSKIEIVDVALEELRKLLKYERSQKIAAPSSFRYKAAVREAPYLLGLLF